MSSDNKKNTPIKKTTQKPVIPSKKNEKSSKKAKVDFVIDYHDILIEMADENGQIVKIKTKSTYGKEGDVINIGKDPKISHTAWIGKPTSASQTASNIKKFQQKYNSISLVAKKMANKPKS